MAEHLKPTRNFRIPPALRGLRPLLVSKGICDHGATLQLASPTPPEVPLALGATIHQFTIQLSHVDRAVYQTLELRAARHPSESEEYLCARVLAHCLEQREGLAFTRGLAESDQPALEVRDLTGMLQAWIEVGSPAADRLHRASKAAPRVAVYTHHDARRYWESLRGARIHRSEALELFGLDPGLVGGMVDRLERRMNLELTVTGGELYLTLGTIVLAGPVESHQLST